MRPLSSAQNSHRYSPFSLVAKVFRSYYRNTVYLLLLLGFILSGCDSNNDDENKEPEVVELLGQSAVVGEYLLLVDKKEDRVFSLDVSLKEEKLASSVKTAAITPNPFWIEAREGGESEALVLSAGRRGVSQPTVLSALTVGKKLEIREYEVGAPFDTILQSDDGRYALLYFSQGSDDVLYSLNEIAVVDLENPGTDPNEKEEDEEQDAEDIGVVRRTVDTSNGVISRIDISPSMKIGQQKRTVAVVLSESRVTIVDLVKATRTNTNVRLGGAADGPAIQPEQVEFNASEREIYVRAANSNDIFVLSLQPAGKDYVTDASQIPVGVEPTDMKLYDSSKLLVVSKGSHDVHLINRSSESDGDDSEVDSVNQEVSIDLNHEAEKIALFQIVMKDKSKKHVALLYQEGSSVVTFLDLVDAEIYKEQNLDTVRLQEPVLDVEVFDDDDLAFVTHHSSRVDIIDMVTRDVRSIRIDNSLQEAVFDTQYARFWMAPPNQPFISYVDLNTGISSPDAVLLDDPIVQFVVANEAEKVVAVHEHIVCDTDDKEDDKNERDSDKDDDEENEEECRDYPISISILDYDDPSRKTLVSFSDFFLK
ncbi:MAG: hypothetical protein JXA30_13220 [Deltaproteobacteria bacterium]|nr:hypothetical protein [Deltaproteobacteria bacterium]